jgi:hypothetical protein
VTIRKNSGTYLPHRALTRAVLTGVGTLVLAGLATACSSAASTPTARGTAASAASTPTARAAAASATTPGVAAGSTPSAAPSAQSAATPAAQPSAAASTQPSDQDVLAPATVPPVDKECSYPVTRTADGNATPLLCQDGRLNVQAWGFYYADFAGSELLRLGQGATATQVYQAMCHDYSDLRMTKPETEGTEELAQAYYGWDVSASSLSVQLTEEGCPAS